MTLADALEYNLINTFILNERMIYMNGLAGLYIHIPFCSGKCLYCDFFSKADNKEEISTYVQHLLDKIEYYSEIYQDKQFDTIYIGGGTPSVIGTEYLAEIVTKAQESFNVISPEITIEMNPKSALNIDFKKLADYSVNRISLGVQSANENELKLLGRRHCNNDVVNAVEKIKSAGIENISLDLMVGISQQTKESLMKSIDFCIKQNPTHISAYILKVEENTPYKKLTPTLDLPDDDMQAELYLTMQNYLSEKGYNQYEISNFAKSGFKSKHNLKYWNCDEYLGIGASAHSMMDNKRFYYPRNFENFYNNNVVLDGAGASAEEYIILKLRLADGFNLSEFEKLFGEPVPTECIKVAKKYSKHNLTIVTDEKIALTKEGFLVSNAIIAEMLMEL